MTLNCRTFARAPLLFAGLFLLLIAPLSAQDSAGRVLSGQIVLDSAGASGVEVELHRVTTSTSGVVGRATSDADGRFTFRLPPIETGTFTVFFATAEFSTVRYFGPTLHPTDEPGEYRIEVYDTTSSPASPVRIQRRDMVLMPQQDGSWEVNEIIRLLNPGRQTVVSGSGMPTVEVDIPERAAAFEAGDGDAPADQVQRMGDRVLLLIPLHPGEREIFFRYRLPARPARTTLALRTMPDTMNLFVRQPSPRLTVEGLEPTELIQVENERFLQYATHEGTRQSEITVRWHGSAGPPLNPVTAAVALSIVVLIGGGVVAYRNRTS
jgi:5-hydroxyisourate hydrolase-like protein (transthyretin family)